MDRDTPTPKHETAFTLTLKRPLRVLTAWQIQKIDETLDELGPFAEVTIIKEKGRVRLSEKTECVSIQTPGDGLTTT
jgi:hypothetical protein